VKTKQFLTLNNARFLLEAEHRELGELDIRLNTFVLARDFSNLVSQFLKILWGEFPVVVTISRVHEEDHLVRVAAGFEDVNVELQILLQGGVIGLQKLT